MSVTQQSLLVTVRTGPNRLISQAPPMHLHLGPSSYSTIQETVPLWVGLGKLRAMRTHRFA